MKLLIIVVTSAVLLQYHSSIQTKLPEELSSKYELLNESFISGSISDVERAKYKQNRTEVAIKITSKISTKKPNRQNVLQKMIVMAREEANILEHLPHHPNIVKFEDSIETHDNIYLIMEYASGGNVYEYLKDHGEFDEDRARVIFKQIVEAVKHCHDHDIAHRDLKNKNLVFDGNNNIKLIDFGVAINFTPDYPLKGFVGSLRYNAPEMLAKGYYNGFETDVWLLGGILYELVCGIQKWAKNDSIFDRVEKGNGELSYEVPVTNDYKDLMRHILEIDPEKRFTTSDILRHKWMKTEGSNTQSG